MSRGPSPSPGPAPSPYAPVDAPPRPTRAPLRVNTELQSNSSRLRSNSTQSSTTLPSLPSHQFSRSLSHNTVALSPSSPINVTGRHDVAMAVNGLRGKEITPVSEELRGEGEELTLRRIEEALEKSSDKGDTLDLSRRGIEEIGAEAVDRFARGVGVDQKGVWRLALSYNALQNHSIDESFCRLSRLRYLNLKGNAFTEFPSALTDLASLEILDLSKNQIEAFPERPGRLAHLKVLSLTNNRIYMLPSYLTTFNSLKVFKVDENPIEWPPREVLGSLIDAVPVNANGRSRKDEDLRPWIENMKSWMRQRAADGDRLIAQNKDEEANNASEEEPSSAVSLGAYSNDMPRWGSRPDLTTTNTSTSTQTVRPLRDETGRASPLHQRLPLLSRNRSATMSDESLARPISPGLYPPNRPFARHDRSQSNSSYTPPHSASTASSSSHSRPPSAVPPPPPPAPSTGHSRGASYTATQRLSGGLTAKKSLPDLRQNHAKIMQERRAEPGESIRPLGLGINTHNGPSRFASPTAWPISPPPAARPRTILRQGSVDMLRDMKTNGDAAKRDSGETVLADESRNSYFRRLSTLPNSTISKTIPPALLKFVDAIRGILFALSQLHAALRQYLLFAVHDRVAGVFNRVMEPASNYMSNLINALDRFDSMSRRGIPPVSAIKGVFNATKESVAVFSKVVAVLRLQMPALQGGDVRYTRTLLLMIYGSVAEVGCSWTAMEPLLAEIKPLLSDRHLGGLAMAPSNSMTGRTPISPIPERGESRSPSSAARSSISTVNASPHNTSVAAVETPAPPHARAQRRRQAGSFSTEDVERGMLMGSPGLSSDTSDDRPSYLRHRPSESAQVVLEDQTEESEEEELMPLPMPPFAKSSRSGSTTGVPMTPPELSHHPQLVGMVQPSQPRRGHGPSSSAGSLSASMPGPLRKLSVDVRPPTPASATLYDEDLLDVIETATDIAFTVWLKLAEDINASGSATSPINSMHHKSASQSSLASTIDSARASDRPSTIPAKHHSDLVLLLSRAEQITTALRESLAGLRANPATWSHTSLPDDAQAFIKTVVKVSELVKIISATHSFPSSVRQSCSRLTQATRECAILIQVSSLRPGASTPAPIPSARPVSPGYRNAGTAASSVEDLSVPHSAGWIGPPSSGLRGLQLPSRHAARKGSTARDPPRSAQASQVAF